jgi:hypothetical protein
MRPVQYFTPEYLEQCKQMTPGQILQFLEEFRLLFAATAAAERLQQQPAPPTATPAR